MRTNPLLLVLLFFFFCFGNLFGQKHFSEELKEEAKQYWHIVDSLQALKQVDPEIKIAERALHQKAIENFEATGNWNEFIAAHIELIKTFQGSADFQNGISQSEQALESIKTHAPLLLKDCGGLALNMGQAFYYAYQNREALEQFSYALDLTTSQHQKDSLLLGKIYNWIGKVSLEFGNLIDAKKFLLKSEELLTHSQKSTDCPFAYQEIHDSVGVMVTYLPECEDFVKQLGDTYTNLGVLYKQKGDLEKSAEYLHKGLNKTLDAVPERDRELINFINQYRALGDYYFETGVHHYSSYFHNKAVQSIEGSGTNNLYYTRLYLSECNYFIAMSYDTLGHAKRKSGYYLEQAFLPIKDDTTLNGLKLKLFLSALDTEINWGYDEDNFQMLYYADSAFLRYQPIAEVEHIDYKTKVQYNRIKAQLLKNKHDYNWYFYETEKEITEWKGDLNQSIMLLLECLKMIPPTADETERADLYARIAEHYELLENRDSLMSYNQQALTGVCLNFNTSHFFDLPDLSNIRTISFLPKILLQRAKIVMAFAKEESQVNKKRELFSLAISIVDLADKYQDRHYKETNLLRLNLGENLMVGLYTKGLASIYELYEIDKDEGMLEKGFYYAQKMKAKQLLLSNIKKEKQQSVNIDAALLEKEKELNLIITDIEANIYETEQSMDYDPFLSSYGFSYEDEWLYSYQKDLELLNKKIAKNYLEDKTSFDAVLESYQSVQDLLTKEELIIEYVTDSEVGSKDDLFIITAAKDQPIKIKKVPINPNVLSYAMWLSSLAENSPMLRKSRREQFIFWSHKIYQQFLLPIEGQLNGKKRLIFIGDGYTGFNNYEVLLKSDEVKPFKDLDYLIKRHEISYHYSSTLFAQARRKNKDTGSGIFAFAPVYDQNTSTKTKLNKPSNIFNASNFRAFDEDGNFTPLPESETEVKEIVTLFREQDNSSLVTLALREMAQEDSLIRHIGKPYKFIHIASHSFMNIPAPGFSGITCYGEDSYNKQILYLNEIYQLDLQADLITLSSCESGNGSWKEGEGVVGLHWSFIYAGTPNVIASFWKVSDKASSKLMIDFYDRVLNGKNYATSLREAKLIFLEQEATASPHFWSPYFLVGR